DDADVVLDCTGTYGQHRWMGDGGIPAVGEAASEAQIAYGVENILGDRRSAYAGKTVLVVGGGYSAATTVSNLAELAEDQPDTGIYRELQARECYARLGPASLSTALIRQTRADAAGGALLPASALSQPEPSFFILGAKSYGRNSQFLLRTGFEQLRQVFSLIMG